MPKSLELLNETIEKIGTAIFKKRREKLGKSLSDIGPGLLFDRTDKVLQEQETKKGKEEIMTISKYEKSIAEQSRRIIESDETLKPLLDKIEDYNNQLALQNGQRKTGDKDDEKSAIA